MRKTIAAALILVATGATAQMVPTRENAARLAVSAAQAAGETARRTRKHEDMMASVKATQAAVAAVQAVVDARIAAHRVSLGAPTRH